MCTLYLTPLFLCSCAVYLSSKYITAASGFSSHNTYKHISVVPWASLTADSMCHQDTSGDNANGYNLSRQALPSVKTCEMCAVINTFSSMHWTLLTCGAMREKGEKINIKCTLNMEITHLNCCFQRCNLTLMSLSCSQLHNLLLCSMKMKISSFF